MKVYQNTSLAIATICKDVLTRNYSYALSVTIPTHKNLDTSLNRIRSAYIRYDTPQQRSRAKRKGEAVFRVVAVPQKRIVWIAATDGYHPHFFRNPNLRDTRNQWVIFGSYKIRRAKKVRIAITDEVYWNTWKSLKSLRVSNEELERIVNNLRWFQSSDTHRQKQMMIRHLQSHKKPSLLSHHI